MTQHDDLLYLGHMLDLARKARDLVGERDKQAYDGDETLQFALTHLVQTLGEAVRQVSPDGRAARPKLPWHRIIGMRHRIVHDYLNIDTDIVWEVVSVNLGPLIDALVAEVPDSSPQ